MLTPTKIPITKLHTFQFHSNFKNANSVNYFISDLAHLYPNTRNQASFYTLKLQYRNLSKIDPPPFLNKVIAKDAFLSKLCPSIDAIVVHEALKKQ